METVSHREMRNRSGEILRRVASGESIEVTNNGRVAAVIAPPENASLSALTERGQVRAARADLSSLRSIKRRRAKRSSVEILADSRGRW